MNVHDTAQLSALKNLADLSGELSALGLQSDNLLVAERLFALSNRLAETTGTLSEATGHSVETVFGI